MHKYEKFWDRISNAYAKKPIKDMEAFNVMINNIRGHLNADDTVLDFGCGTGTYSIAVADAVKAIQGIDISQKMLAIAQQRAEEKNISNIQFEQLNLFDSKLQPESFDAVLCFNILHLQEDVDAVLKRISELLSPQGVLISKTVCIGEKPGLMVRFMRFLSRTGLVPFVACIEVSQLKNSIKALGMTLLEEKQILSEHMEFFLVARKV